MTVTVDLEGNLEPMHAATVPEYVIHDADEATSLGATKED
jgi:hypothetical protein